MKFILLFLTCRDKTEADKISQKLLGGKLAFCIKKLPVESSFLWQGKIDSGKEFLLIMESLEKNFEKIEKRRTLSHSPRKGVYFLL